MKVKLKPNTKHRHGEKTLYGGEEFDLPESQIPMLADKLDLPAGYVPGPIVASTDFIDPLTGQATRTPNPSQPEQAQGPTGLEQQQLKAAQEKEIRDKGQQQAAKK